MLAASDYHNTVPTPIGPTPPRWASRWIDSPAADPSLGAHSTNQRRQPRPALVKSVPSTTPQEARALLQSRFTVPLILEYGQDLGSASRSVLAGSSILSDIAFLPPCNPFSHPTDMDPIDRAAVFAYTDTQDLVVAIPACRSEALTLHFRPT
jgi:hypothetical protein